MVKVTITSDLYPRWHWGSLVGNQKQTVALNGVIYVIYRTYTGGSANLKYAYSSDRGDTWTEGDVTGGMGTGTNLGLYIVNGKVWAIYVRSSGSMWCMRIGTQQGDDSLSWGSEKEIHNNQPPNSSTGAPLIRVCNTLVYCVTEGYDGSNYRGMISKTGDDGDNWTIILNETSGTIFGGGYAPTISMARDTELGDDAIIIVAIKYGNAAVYYKRYDGTSWQEVWTSIGLDIAGGSYRSCSCQNINGEIWLWWRKSGTSGVFWTNRVSGVWQNLPSGINFDNTSSVTSCPSSVHIPSKNLVYIAYRVDTNVRIRYRLTSGGDWTSVVDYDDAGNVPLGNDPIYLENEELRTVWHSNRTGQYLFIENPPEAPTNLSAACDGSTKVDLTWTDNSTEETSYEVQRDDGGWHTIASLPADSQSYTDDTIACDTAYLYRVKACRGFCSDPLTLDEAITCPCPVPADPTDLKACCRCS